MGTVTNWIEVGVSAIFWGGAMLLWTTHRRKAANIKPALSYVDVLFWVFGALEFGLLTTYGWQALHRPLIFLLLLAFVGALITAGLRPAASPR
jgi:hypothetical protein